MLTTRLLASSFLPFLRGILPLLLPARNPTCFETVLWGRLSSSTIRNQLQTAERLRRSLRGLGSRGVLYRTHLLNRFYSWTYLLCEMGLRGRSTIELQSLRFDRIRTDSLPFGPLYQLSYSSRKKRQDSNLRPRPLKPTSCKELS